jgi:hypothetical protein
MRTLRSLVIFFNGTAVQIPPCSQDSAREDDAQCRRLVRTGGVEDGTRLARYDDEHRGHGSHDQRQKQQPGLRLPQVTKEVSAWRTRLAVPR